MSDPLIAKTEALSAEEEASVRSRHDPYETGFFGGNPPDLACRQCSRPWPCDGSRLLATVDAAREQAATEARRELLAALENEGVVTWGDEGHRERFLRLIDSQTPSPAEERCGERSSVSDARCILPPGHAPDSQFRAHRFSPTEDVRPASPSTEEPR